jgi:hypothetical protein
MRGETGEGHRFFVRLPVELLGGDAFKAFTGTDSFLLDLGDQN